MSGLDAFSENLSIAELIQQGAKSLQEVAGDRSVFESRLLLAKAFGCSVVDLIADNAEFTEKGISLFKNFIERRVEHEPVAYIVGSKEFYGRDFFVNKNVLIPRPETEGIIDLCLHRFALNQKSQDEDQCFKVLELGVGSGCISLTLSKEAKCKIEVVGIDVSEEALKIADQNMKSQKLSSVQFLKLDLRDGPLKDWENQFDVLLTNPPYIPEGDLQSLSRDIFEYEPKLALSGGEDGLDLFREIYENWLCVLKKSGVFISETYDEGQREKLKALFGRQGSTEEACFFIWEKAKNG